MVLSSQSERGAKVAYQRRLRQITCSTVKMASELFFSPLWWKNCPGIPSNTCAEVIQADYAQLSAQRSINVNPLLNQFYLVTYRSDTFESKGDRRS